MITPVTNVKLCRLFMVEICGSNPARTATVIQDLELSKHANTRLYLSITDAYTIISNMDVRRYYIPTL